MIISKIYILYSTYTFMFRWEYLDPIYLYVIPLKNFYYSIYVFYPNKLKCINNLASFIKHVFFYGDHIFIDKSSTYPESKHFFLINQLNL